MTEVHSGQLKLAPSAANGGPMAAEKVRDTNGGPMVRSTTQTLSLAPNVKQTTLLVALHQWWANGEQHGANW